MLLFNYFSLIKSQYLKEDRFFPRTESESNIDGNDFAQFVTTKIQSLVIFEVI